MPKPNNGSFFICRVRSADEDMFTSEEAKQFISGLESHFYEIFNVKLAVSTLRYLL